MSVTQINSDTILDDIDRHFRVSAGPGAGKTHWLVEHIKNVLHRSNKLSKTKKVVCITYTNIAVETILKRLGTSVDQVEISTIHSFLYKHILKPYASFIASEFNLNVVDMDGHDEIILSNYGFLNEWKTRTGQQRIREDDVVVKAFKSIKWKFDNSGELIAKTDYPHRIDNYSIKTSSYLEYKKMTWEKGIVHHDDVLFLSYQIIKKFPFALDVLQAKFPYFFIDEFQDSNPIQVEILKQISQRDVIIGIIGDKAQSIYRFQGADPSQFHGFSITNLKDYVMSDNRRSTNEIVNVLNGIRTDIYQNPHRNIRSNPPFILVGEMSSALRRAKLICGVNAEVHSLSRNNVTSNAMKLEIGGMSLNGRLFEDLKKADKDNDRCNLVLACIKSAELARENKFKDSIKEMQRIFNYNNDKLKGKRKALKCISILLENYNSYKDGTLLEFSSFLKNEIKSDLTKVSRGSPKTFYEAHSYQQLALCVKVPEDTSKNKTIHKAKGDEFDNVLLVLQKESDLEFLVNPNMSANTDDGEEHRINYVAVSRAKNRLFISVPTLGVINENALKTKFTIENV